MQKQVNNDNTGKNPIKNTKIQKLISKFPRLYIILKSDKTNLKNLIINIKGYKAIKTNKLLDKQYYLKKNTDVETSGKDPILHYLYQGSKEGRKPNPTFDGNYYLKKYEDVRKLNINPLIHYALYGKKEKRKTIEKKVIIRGSINTIESNKPIIKGWLAEINNNIMRTAILNINDNKFEINCNNFRSDLKKSEINEGNHSFEFNVPIEFVDGNKHKVQLIDKITGKLIDKTEATWIQNHNFIDFSGFLSNSLVAPVVYAPFREEDKRCFGTMENITKHLVELSKNLESEDLVSVIMPVHNRVKEVKYAVDSVLTQTYSNIELIIVNDGSNDGSKELLEEISDKRVILLHNKSCQGVSNARNRALKIAKGKYIAYLDSDNVWDSRYVSSMIGAFSELSDADALYCGQVIFNGEEKNPCAVRFGSFNKSLLFNNNYIDLNAFCHTQDLYKRSGGFDTNLSRYVDWDWFMQIAQVAKIYSVPVLLSYYYYNKADNTLTKNKNLIPQIEIVREKHAKKINSEKFKCANVHFKGVSIIIPSYESLEDIKECLNSILALEKDDCLEIIVVDNASNQPTIEYLESLESQDKIKFIKNEVNYGFTYAVNQGISIAKPNNDIMLMNNDALITPGAIEALQKSAYSLPQCGLVVPQQVLPGGTETINIHVPYADPKYSCDVNLSAHHSNIINVPIFHSGERAHSLKEILKNLQFIE